MSDAPPPLSTLHIVFHTLIALAGWLVLGGLLAMPLMMLDKAGLLSASATSALLVWATLAALVIPVLRRGVAHTALRARMRRPWIIPLALGIVMAANVQIAALLGSQPLRVEQPGIPRGAVDVSFEVLYSLGIAVATPVVEELFFRGWLWLRLASVWPPVAVGMATGTAFALAHGMNAATVLPLTVALTLLRLQDGGVRSAIALHIAMNTLVVGFAVYSLF